MQESENEMEAAVETATPESEVAPAGDTDVRKVVEAILFVSKTPLPAAKLCDILQEFDKEAVRAALDALVEDYEAQARPFHIVKLADGYQMLTRPEYAPWLMNMYRKRREEKISAAALETLAIIAYKQPITRAALESIRGVNCDYAVKALMERDLIRIAGREETLGRPLQYGTTKKFLNHFGLSSVKDLPDIEDITHK